MTETRRAAASWEMRHEWASAQSCCLALLAYLGVYAIAAATLGAVLLPALPAWGELLFYAVAGVIWIFPLKPLFAWMNRG